MGPHGADPTARRQLTLRDDRYTTNASRDVLVDLAAFADTHCAHIHDNHAKIFFDILTIHRPELLGK